MMEEINIDVKDTESCFLNVNWNDLDQNSHRVGFLSLYNERFYFMIRGKENIQRAYQHGFGGIPGVLPDKIYVSNNEMFDILKKRLGLREADKAKIDIMKELLESRIESENTFDNRRDRLSFEGMSDREIEECKKLIDEEEQEATKKDEAR